MRKRQTNCYDVDLFRSHTSVHRKIDIRQNNNFLSHNAVDIFYVNSIWMMAQQPNADILLCSCSMVNVKEGTFGFVVSRFSMFNGIFQWCCGVAVCGVRMMDAMILHFHINCILNALSFWCAEDWTKEWNDKYIHFMLLANDYLLVPHFDYHIWICSQLSS